MWHLPPSSAESAAALDQVRRYARPVFAQCLRELTALPRRQSPPQVVGGQREPDRAGAAETGEARHARILSDQCPLPCSLPLSLALPCPGSPPAWSCPLPLPLPFPFPFPEPGSDA